MLAVKTMRGTDCNAGYEVAYAINSPHLIYHDIHSKILATVLRESN